MRYAYKNGKILDGTRDMQVREGYSILTDGDRITDIVPDQTSVEGYQVIDLQGDT